MTTPPLQPAPVRPASDRRTPVTLPTWVNVVLVLILFVSCGAATDSTPAPPSSSEIADQVTQRLQNGGGGSGIAPASGEDVQDLCRLMGAVLAGQNQKVDTVIGADATTQCAEAAREGAAPH